MSRYPSNKKIQAHKEVNKSIYKWTKLFPIYYRKYDIKYVQIWYGLYATHWTEKKKKKKRVPETYYRVLADDSLQFFIANFVLLFPQR